MSKHIWLAGFAALLIQPAALAGCGQNGTTNDDDASPDDDDSAEPADDDDESPGCSLVDGAVTLSDGLDTPQGAPMLQVWAVLSEAIGPDGYPDGSPEASTLIGSAGYPSPFSLCLAPGEWTLVGLLDVSNDGVVCSADDYFGSTEVGVEESDQDEVQIDLDEELGDASCD